MSSILVSDGSLPSREGCLSRIAETRSNILVGGRGPVQRKAAHEIGEMYVDERMTNISCMACEDGLRLPLPAPGVGRWLVQD